jgi:hypothetical protein
MSCLPVLSIIEYPNGSNSSKSDWHMYVMFDYSKNKYFLTGKRRSDKHCYNFYFYCDRSLIHFIQYSMDVKNTQVRLSYEMYGFDTDNHPDFLNYNFYDFKNIFDSQKYELFAYDNEKHNHKMLHRLLDMLEFSSHEVVKSSHDDYGHGYDDYDEYGLESAYD